MIVLGIETSCDETGIGIVRDETEVLSNVVASSLEQHSRYGGVIPEIAARAHIDDLIPVLEQALQQAGIALDAIDAVAVTYGPGLPGALLAGVAFAKGISLALGCDLIPVDHLAAHLHAAYIKAGAPEKPCLGLIVSGGHTLLCRMEAPGSYTLLGETRDDAVGEAFDKVARMLGLGYPGGPVIDRLAMEGDPGRFDFPRSNTKHRFDFSFSGLKTAVLQQVRSMTIESGCERVDDASLPHLAASFQEAAVDMIVRRVVNASKETGLQTVLMGGGVTLNTRLRERLQEAARRNGFEVVFPDASQCSDNGAMIAAVGAALLKRGVRARLDLTIDPGLCLTPYAGEFAA